MEGALLGIPSIAVSVASMRSGYQFGPVAEFTATLAAQVVSQGLPAKTLLNVNAPNLARHELKGYRFTHQGKRHYSEKIEVCPNPRGKQYYWIGGDDLGFDQEEGTDCTAIHEGFISITPLQVDFTNYRALQDMRDMKLPWQ